MAVDENTKFGFFKPLNHSSFYPKKNFILKISADVNKDEFIFGY